jgi:hypothetical protein
VLAQPPQVQARVLVQQPQVLESALALVLAQASVRVLV